ncbi:MAG: formate dehydrogenase subunit alpha [Thermoplasmata archaeon]
MVGAYIDGQEIAVPPGATVLQAMLQNRLDVPHICYHPSLGPLETCDTCLVEIDGQVARACSTPLREGMQVRVERPDLSAARMERMQKLLLDHNLYCTICDKNNGDCVLHNTALRMDVQDHEFRPKPYPIDASNPFFVYDPKQCILCGRCVEACQDVVVNEVITIDWKRDRPRVIFDHDVAVNRSSCVSCGTCQTVCPVDALMEKGMLGQASHFSWIPANAKERLVELTQATLSNNALWAISEVEAHTRQASIQRTKTVCTFCGVGCSFEVWTKGRKILKIFPKPESPANNIATCVKGKFGWDFVNSPARLTQPLLRHGDRFVESTWDEAIAYIAGRLTEIKQAHGPNSIGVIATCTGTSEEAYLAQKFARQVIGTHNIDNCARYCQAPATMGLIRTVGIGADSGNFEQIEAADLVLTFGSNTAESHPVLAGKIKQAGKLRGQRLIVFDVRKHEMAERAHVYVRPNPGTDLAVVNAIARYILDQGWQAEEFIRDRTTRFEEYSKSLEPFTLEFAESVSGVPRDTMVRVAEMIHAAATVCILWAMGITQHGNGADTCTSFCNLLLLTGNFGRRGTGGYPLRGHCNVQGVSDFGALPTYLPGYQRWDDPEVVARFEEAWGVTLPKEKGLTSTEMTDGMLDGRIHAMYIIGEDKALADADGEKVARALTGLDLLVYQDLFMTRTAEFADVILPAAASLEKEGTFINTERRIQRLYRALPPLGNARTDLEITQSLARAMGADWAYPGPKEILAECASLAPIFAGAEWDRLSGFHSLLWPVDASGKDSPNLYEERFSKPDGKATFHPTEWAGPDAPDAEFDLSLDNGRMLEHFHWGNMTGESAGLRAKVPEVFIEVSPELAKARGIQDGDMLRLTGRNGRSLRSKALITHRVEGRTLFLSLHDNQATTINQLTSDRRDPPTNTPSYKELPVKLEKLGPGLRGEPPLPLTNPRFGHRNPQVGVVVREKWARPDYAPPSGVGP